MRVLVVTTWYPDADHPTLVPFCRQHVEAIATGHQVQVIHIRLGSTSEDEDVWDHGVQVHRRALRPKEPGTIAAVRRTLRSYARDADLVHTMAFSSALVQALAVPSAPWVHTEHWNGVVNPAQEGGLWPRVAFLRHVLRLTDCATGVTTQLTDVLGRFTRPGCTHLVPCVVATPDRVVPLPAGPSLPMMATGHLIDRKDPLTAVRTLALVRERGIDATLTWVGTGPLADQTRELASELGVEPHLELTGAIPLEQVVARLAQARMFFLPTRHENFFVSAAEAIGSGRPVVVGATGGHDDYINDSNGALVDRQDPLAYADAIETMYRRLENGDFDPEQLHDQIAARFGAEAVGRSIEDAYHVAIQQRPGRLWPPSRRTRHTRP